MSPIVEHVAPGQHAVALWQRANGKFIVTYGLQTKDQLTYAQAAREFGECVMHACTCAGEIVNLESDDFLQACGIRA